MKWVDSNQGSRDSGRPSVCLPGLVWAQSDCVAAVGLHVPQVCEHAEAQRGSQGTENSLVAFEDQKPFDMVVTIKCLLFKY